MTPIPARGSRRMTILVGILLIAAYASLLSCRHERREPSHVLAARIVSTSTAETTAVLVLFDDDLFRYLRSQLPTGFNVVALRYPDAPQNDSLTRLQLGRLYRDAAAAT